MVTQSKNEILYYRPYEQNEINVTYYDPSEDILPWLQKQMKDEILSKLLISYHPKYMLIQGGWSAFLHADNVLNEMKPLLESIKKNFDLGLVVLPPLQEEEYWVLYRMMKDTGKSFMILHSIFYDKNLEYLHLPKGDLYTSFDSLKWY